MQINPSCSIYYPINRLWIVEPLCGSPTERRARRCFSSDGLLSLLKIKLPVFQGSWRTWFRATHLEAYHTLQKPKPMFASPGGAFPLRWRAGFFFKNGDSLRKQGTTFVLRVGGSKATAGNRWQPGPAGRLARSHLDFHLHYARRTDWAVFHECALLWRSLHGGPCHCILGIPFIGPLKIPSWQLVTHLKIRYGTRPSQ